MKSDLDKAKNLADMFLYYEMEKTSFSPAVVIHPFFESAILCDNQGIFNAFEEKERYSEYLKCFSARINECKNLSALVNIVRKSFRLTFISFLYDVLKLPVTTCGNLLAEQWTTIETLTYDTNVKPRRVLFLIKAAEQSVFMNKSELKVFQNLPEELVIYRGCRDKKGVKACSWTLDEEQAKWFSARWNKNYVFKAKIKKADVIAYKSDRNEQEIVVNFYKLYDIEQI